MSSRNEKKFEIQSLILSFIAIAICEAVFLLDVAADKFDLDIDVEWLEHGWGEAISAITLAIALVIIGLQISRLLREHRESQDFVKVASGEFLTVIYRRFDEWQLTSSEAEIALFLIKGLSAQEIADLRETRIGTVKSQSSMIYQKSGVRGRHELVAYFVEDLLAGERINSAVI